MEISRAGYFGLNGITSICDIDGNGLGDLAVGANAANNSHGEVCIVLFSRPTPTQIVATVAAVIPRPSGSPANFGRSLAWVAGPNPRAGRLLVGAPGAAPDTGDVLYFDISSSQVNTVSVGSTIASLIADLGFVAAGNLAPGDFLGNGLAFGRTVGSSFDDLMFVGATGDDNPGSSTPTVNCGACWVCKIAPDGRVTAQTKISQLTSGFRHTVAQNAWLGQSLAFLGDTDADGDVEVCMGAAGWSAAGNEAHGIVYCVELDIAPSGAAAIVSNVEIHQGVGGSAGRFGGICLPTPSLGNFGYDMALVGDTNRDGRPELMIGAPGTRDSMGTIVGEVLFVDYSAWFRTTAAVTPYGRGCAGAGREPQLWANSPPYLDNINFRLIGSDAPPNGLTALGIGVQQQALDLGVNAPGCTLLLDPLLFLFSAADASGVATYRLPIPPQCGLLGSFLRVQLVVFDRAANPLGLLTSRGAVLSIEH
jgi:hypothetical protein